MRIAAQRIGLVKLGAIGDVVNALPFVHRLRLGYPAAEITWIIGPVAHALIEGHRAVDRFLVLDVRDRGSWPAFLRTLRGAHLDLVVDLQRILKSGLIARASGAPQRLGFDRARCKEASWLFTNHKLAPNARPGVTVEQYLEFADWLACPASETHFDLPIAECTPPNGDRVRIVVNVGASKPSNRWPAASWARLCALLLEEFDAEIHLTGGAVDRAVVLEVRRGQSASLIDQAGRLTLKESAGLIRSARLFIGGDTGPLHIAAAVGTPCIALFGASDPARTGPFGPGHTLVSHPVPCSPCRRRHCNVPGHPCMTGLAPELVFARARAQLAPARTRA